MKEYLLDVLQKTKFLNFTFRVYEWLKLANLRYLMPNITTWRKGSPDGLPLPPLKLIVLVSGVPSIAAFLIGGDKAAQNIRDLLVKNNLKIEEQSSILDFGCGCGRVIRYWHSLPNVNVHGSDYNPELINWCRKELKFAQFQTNQLEPPLAYPDESFDLIYALSVFTHLPEPLQFAWMQELCRVLKPKGHLLFSTHGEANFDLLTEIEKKQFKANQLVVRYEEVSGTNLCATFHPVQYIYEELAQGFDVVDFVFQGAYGNGKQDITLFQKSS